MARLSKLTPEVQEAICKRIAAGNYAEAAAVSAGISERTFYRWMKQGRKATRGPFWQFCRAVKKAEADAEVRNVAIIQKAAQGGHLIEKITRTRKDGTTEVIEKFARPEWTAAAWSLERKYPERWAKRELAQIAELREKIVAFEKNTRTQQADSPAAALGAPVSEPRRPAA